jgi:REP element-mobilizing transposase RayT
VFEDELDRVHLLGLFSRAAVELDWRFYAYCLMGNHYHLLVNTPEPNLSSGMRLIQTRHAHRFNSRHGRKGHVFGDRFHDRLVDEDDHLLAAAVYTVMNPVRAGIVVHPREWQWSSYRATAGLDDQPGFLDVAPLLAMLSPDRERARMLYREMIEVAAARSRASMVAVTTQE